MQKFNKVQSKIIPLLQNDIDTDQIIPAKYLKVTDKAGLADGLFAGWRYLPDGQNDPDFPLNQSDFQGAEILLTGDNFGCGSSREHAPWALIQWGIRAIISTSFADIFRSNAYKNGLLPIEVSSSVYQSLVDGLASAPGSLVSIDLPSQQVSLPDGFSFDFEIDPFSKTCLVEGIDQLGYLMGYLDQVNNYEISQQTAGVFRVNTLKGTSRA
jgi:3-isopropylmalate/(R)-2-methylmalate dehydratase small subunit